MGQFDMPVYFSESQQQNVRVEEMPLPYARNVLLKLYEEDGFEGSALQEALFKRLIPPQSEIENLLRFGGIASIYAPSNPARMAARSKFRRAGKRIGKKVRTHQHGEFIEGSVVVNIRVRGR